MKDKPQRRLPRLSIAVLAIVVTALLLIDVLSNTLPYYSKTDCSSAKSDILAICTAIDTYTIDNSGALPDSLVDLVTPDVDGFTYIKDMVDVPLDPWGNPYVYVAPKGDSPYLVLSYGRDGKEGGVGGEADIDNLTMRGLSHPDSSAEREDT